MSASDFGYLRVARWFNERGWNTVFPHLPFHYSRTPRGCFNGELAITANMIHNGETLRQGVVELRQLMAMLREEGCTEFGVLGTSFGGWNGALLSFLETDFRFIALIQPIVNIEHAIWQNPGSVLMRRLLRSRGILPGESERHAHLSSPLHGIPLCGGDRVVITAGVYDRLSPASDLLNLKRRWSGARLLEVRQGHFGYRALRETLKEIEKISVASRGNPVDGCKRKIPRNLSFRACPLAQNPLICLSFKNGHRRNKGIKRHAGEPGSNRKERENGISKQRPRNELLRHDYYRRGSRR